MTAVQSPTMTTPNADARSTTVSGDIPPGVVAEISPGVFAISLPPLKALRVRWVAIIVVFLFVLTLVVGVIAGLAGAMTSSAPAATVAACAVIGVVAFPIVRRYTRRRRALIAEFANAADRIRAGADRVAVITELFAPYADEKHASKLHFTPTRWDRGLMRDIAALFPTGSVVLIPWNDASGVFAPLTSPFEPVPLTHAFTLGDSESASQDAPDPLAADRFSWEPVHSAKIRRRRIWMWISRIGLTVFVITIVLPMLNKLLVTGRMPPSVSRGIVFGVIFISILGVAVSLQRRWHILPGGVAVQPSIFSSLWRTATAARYAREDSTLIVWWNGPIVCRSDGRVELSGQPQPARSLEALIRAWRCTAPTPPPEFLRNWFGEDPTA